MKVSTNNLSKNVNKKGNTRKGFRNHSIFNIVLLFIPLYIAVHIFRTIYNGPPRFEEVKEGLLQQKVAANALIIRNEQNIFSPKEGHVTFEAKEGEKVRKGGSVLFVSTSGNIDKIHEKIDDLNQEIYDIQKNRKEVSSVGKDVTSLDNNIDQYVTYIKKSLLDQDLDNIELSINKIQNVIDKKNIHLESEANVDETLAAKITEKNRYETQLNSLSKSINSPSSGIIAYQKDRYDGSLYNVLRNEKDPFSLIENNESIKTSTKVNMNDFLFRLVDPYSWKVILSIPKEIQLENNQKVKLESVVKGIELDGTVVKVYSANEDLNNVIISLTKGIEYFLNERTAEVNFIYKEASGLQIPASSIVERNYYSIPKTALDTKKERQGVWLIKNNSVQFAELTSFDETDEEYLIPITNENVKMDDWILLDPKQSMSAKMQLKEIQTQKGVYVLLGGVTKFKPVQVLAVDGKLAVVKSNSVEGVKVFDRVITNPTSIKDNELIKR